MLVNSLITPSFMYAAIAWVFTKNVTTVRDDVINSNRNKHAAPFEVVRAAIVL
jgi:hypothetical protein